MTEPILIAPRITVRRRGVDMEELAVLAETPPVVEMNAMAAVKMSLTGLFRNMGRFDPATDTLGVCMLVNGEEYPLGEYVVVAAEERVGGSPAVRLTALDVTVRARQSILEESAFFPEGALYMDAVRMLLMQSGITRMELEESDDAFAADREDWPAGTDRLSVVNTLLREIGYNSLYMDLTGTVRATAYRRADGGRARIRYDADETSILYAGSSTTRDIFRHPNVFYVAVENSDLPDGMQAVAVNDSATNPFSTLRMGRVPKFIVLPGTPGPEALRRFAENEKFRSMAAVDETVFETGPNPVHGVFEVLALHKPEATGIYEETYWWLPLAHNARMRHRAKRTVIEL